MGALSFPWSGDISGGSGLDTDSISTDAISTQALDSEPASRQPDPATAALPPTRRLAVAPSKAASSAGESPFARLPVAVIELILWLSDPNTFASLVILNRQWRTVSQKAPLYAYHLSSCPSYALSHHVITKPSQLNDLRWLKAKFAREARRNLFDAFIHPSETMVNLISTSANSSAAFPRGEALRFIFSSQGQTLLALSSTRVFVIDLLSDPLTVKRELKTARRPIAAAVTNDGSLLALLSTRHQVNIYALTESGIRHLQVIMLHHPPGTIALANEGTVLAAAYEGGVEVFSLAANALSTDRRAVRCEAVDSMSFSADGSTLLGSSYNTADSNTVIITAPFYAENDPNLSTRDLHSRMWTTQILFPQNSSTCSHAVLLNSHNEGDITWLFVYDRSLNTYRAVRADDTRTGVAYFLGPDRRRHSTTLPSMLPSVSMSGELAVAGFSGAGLYVYGIPERLDNAPDMRPVFQREERSTKGLDLSLTSATGRREPLMAYSPPLTESDAIEDDFLSGGADWPQSLFVRSRPISDLEDAVAAAWVEEPNDRALPRRGKRLVVVAPGGVRESSEDMYEDYLPLDGGRILLLDFDYAPHGPKKRTMTIEVGQKTPEMLPEQRGSLDVEVDLARRRSNWGSTDLERRRGLARSVTAIVPSSARMSTHLEEGGSRTSISQPPSPTDGPSPIPLPSKSTRHLHRHTSLSQDHLPRSVSATGVKSSRYPPRPPLDSTQRLPSSSSSNKRTHERRTVASLPMPRAVDNWEAPPPYRRSPDRGATAWKRNDATLINSPRQVPTLESAFIPVQRPKTVWEGNTASPVLRGRSSPNGSAIEGRPRGPSDISSTTWRTRLPGSQISRAHSMTCSVSPISSPRSIRPVGRRPSASSLAMGANVISPMSEIAIPHPQRAAPSLVDRSDAFAPITAPVRVNGRPTPTLTGANLQNRLNHPVPPRPLDLSHDLGATYIPMPLRVGRATAPSTPPPHTTVGSFSTTTGRADQTSHMNLYVAASKRRPVSMSPFMQSPTISDGQNDADRRSIGPASASAFNGDRRSLKHNSRARSRPKQRPESVPDLPVPMQHYNRLGMRDGAGGVPLPRASSNDGDLPPEPSRHGERRSATYPRAKSSRKQRRGDKVSSEGSEGGKRAKRSRCIVM